MDACLLWELWCGQSVLPVGDSSMVIGAIDANLGLQIVLQDCGWAALAGFLPYLTAKNWEAVTTRNKCPIVRYTTLQAVLHGWLFRRDFRPHRNHLGADRRCRFRACTADRPSCSQKSTRLKNLFHSSKFLKTMNTQDLLVLLISFSTACFALNIYKINRSPQH